MNNVDASVARYFDNLVISIFSPLLSHDAQDTAKAGKAPTGEDEDVGTDLFAMLDRHTALVERRKVAWRTQCVARMRQVILTAFPLPVDDDGCGVCITRSRTSSYMYRRRCSDSHLPYTPPCAGAWSTSSSACTPRSTTPRR